MYNYDLLDVNGKKIGVISLETEDLPVALMEGQRFRLSCSYVDSNPQTVLGRIKARQTGKQFLSFRVCPEPSEAALLRRNSRVITGRIDRVE